MTSAFLPILSSTLFLNWCPHIVDSPSGSMLRFTYHTLVPGTSKYHCTGWWYTIELERKQDPAGFGQTSPHDFPLFANAWPSLFHVTVSRRVKTYFRRQRNIIIKQTNHISSHPPTKKKTKIACLLACGCNCARYKNSCFVERPNQDKEEILPEKALAAWTLKVSV